MPDGAKRLERLRAQIEEEPLREADYEILQAFDDELTLRSHEYSQLRHAKLLRHCLFMARETETLAEAIEDREAAEEIVRWVNRTYSNEETNSDFRTALRVFGKYVSEGDDEVPPSISWVTAGTSKSYDPSPNPAEMLKWDEDVQPMLDACHNDRDRALIAVAWDLGARSGEFRKIRIGDLADGRYGMKVHLDGKTGQRSPTLVPSVPYLQAWLDKHPRRDDDTALLWCKLQSGEEMSYRMFLKIPKTAAKRAGVNKPVTLTNFRKSSASYLASQGVSQPHLEDHHGWVRGSDHAARYIAVFGEAAEREIAKAHGVEIDEEESEPTHTPVTCPRCERETPRDKDFCMWCNQALSQDAIEDIREETRDVRASLLSAVADSPDLLGEIDSMEEIVRLIDENPGTVDDAQAFIEALGD